MPKAELLLQRDSGWTTDFESPYSTEKKEETERIRKAYFKARAAFKERLKLAKQEVNIHMPSNESIRILGFSDIHFAHDAVDHDALDKFVDDITNDPKAYLLLLGDEIEGIKDEYLRTNVTKTAADFDEQIRIFKNEYLKKLASRKKVLAIVSGYEGHNEWSNTKSTVDSIRDMVEELGIPVVENGGFINLHFPDKSRIRIRMFHNPGSGSNKNNPLGALRNRLSENTFGDGFPDAVANGHIHTTALSAEQVFDKLSGQTRTYHLASHGTLKGTDSDNQDTLFLVNARTPPDKSGIYYIIHDGKKEGQVLRPVLSTETSRFLTVAYQLWDNAQRNQATQELVDKVTKSSSQVSPKPAANYHDARRSHNQWSMELTHGMYEKLPISLRTDLPVIIFPLSHMRVGSGSFNRKGFDSFVNKIVSYPNAYGISIGELLDFDVAEEKDREYSLALLVRSLKPMDDHNRHLALQFMGGLRHDSWGKRHVVKPENYRPHKDVTVIHEEKNGRERIVYPPIVPSKYLREHGINAPFILHESIVPLRVGRVDYLTYYLYHLNHSGNTKNLFQGLDMAANNTALPIDVVMGGHLPNSGYLQTHRRTLMPPGWWSEFKAQNKANLREVPPGGQSVILFPEEKRIIASASQADSFDTFEATYIAYGLKKAGTLEEIQRRLSRNKSPSTRKKI